jgi:hypothetical protein
MHAVATLTASPGLATTQPAPAVERPHLGAIVRHLSLSLLMATVIPSLLFYGCLVAGDIWAALVAALAWCYGAMAWRIRTKRPRSALLWITAIGLTAKTGLSIATGSTLIYFLQPAINDMLIAALFLVSLASARPLVARLAADFYPMSQDVAARPRVQQLFWRLTLFWAVLCLGKSVATLWLLASTSTVTFVAVKTGLTVTVAVLGAATTVVIASRVARREGLLRAR